MPAKSSSVESEIRQRIHGLVARVRDQDVEGVMAAYSPGIVSFDVVPPLRHVDAGAKRKNWIDAFAAYDRPLFYDIRDLAVCAGDDVAFAYSLNCIRGTLKGGRATAVWVRWTACFRKIEGSWLIVHDHVSVPADPEGGRALLDLQP